LLSVAEVVAFYPSQDREAELRADFPTATVENTLLQQGKEGLYDGVVNTV
jgi:hypothetical protein